MPKLTSVIRYLEAAARLLGENPTHNRDTAINMLNQAGMSGRSIVTILADYNLRLSQVQVARIIKASAPELPL